MAENSHNSTRENHAENKNEENIHIINHSNSNSSSKFSMDSFAAPNFRFASQNDLGKLFATQGSSGGGGSNMNSPGGNINNNAITSNSSSNTTISENATSYFDQTDQYHTHTPLFRKIARPMPPSLNTNFTQLLMAHNNNTNGLNSSPFSLDSSNVAASPEDVISHRRRDSNVSAMSIQMYDAAEPTHQRRDSNVSNISMQLDTPTPSSGSSNPQFMRRLSMDVNMDNNYLAFSSSSPSPSIIDQRNNEKPSPMQRAVRARRASLLPKTKSFQRIVHELQDESRPLETEIKQEYKTTKVLMNESEKYMDSDSSSSENILSQEFLATWSKFRDVQPSPPPYTASKLNPEVEMSFRQDTPSPTSSIAGPWPVSSRIKRKASDDRFEPYFNPKRRAVSPSLVGSPPIVGVPSPPMGSTSPIGVMSTSTNSTPSTPLQQEANGKFGKMSLSG
ncbi:8654_t:CDS:2 [Ambispora gerdemannii]|uniref:8654_t:CDS:1 n=1 Tax=Ambispora gerdemannii TaxID=144530 RepID=A0A9N9A5I1_9GLOM|nr:8654_t:CDS:2 [Ambispora gerdemannii]